MLMIAAVHLLGLGCVALLMIPALRDTESSRRQSDSGNDDGWGNDRRRPDRPRGPIGGLPLPDAEPARARLREHGRLHERRPPRERRPAREPERGPTRAPDRPRTHNPAKG